MNHIVMKFPSHLKSVFNKNFEVLVDDLAPVGPPADDVTFCVPSTTYPCYWRYCYIFTIIQVRYGHSCIHIGNIDVYFFYNCIRLWVLSNDTCSPPWKILDMGQYHTVYRRFSWYDFLKFINGVFLCLSFVIWLLDISFSITSVFFFFWHLENWGSSLYEIYDKGGIFWPKILAQWLLEIDSYSNMTVCTLMHQNVTSFFFLFVCYHLFS